MTKMPPFTSASFMCPLIALRQCYVLIWAFCIMVPLHLIPLYLAQGNSSALPIDSQYYFVSQPISPRIYARSPPGVEVVKVLAQSRVPGLFNPSIKTAEGRLQQQEIDDESTAEDMQNDDDLEALPIACFPHYYFFKNNKDADDDFYIGKCDGKISTARYIEEDLGFVFNLTVLAKDLLNFTLATLDLKIVVSEYNAHPPHLNQKMYSQEVLEAMKVGDLIAAISAHDNDTEPYNKELYFYLRDKSNFDKDPWFFPTTVPFVINYTTGEIRLTSSLENLTSPLYFKVGVADGGSPQRSHDLNMTIHIRNMSAPRNIKILNTTETSITVCWSAPVQGVPEGYLISSQPRNSNVRTSITSLNITVEQLQLGTAGFMYDSLPSIKVDGEEVLTTEAPHKKELKNFFLPQYCATLDGLMSYSNYAISIRGWAHEKVSMARMPLTTVTRKRSCFNNTCVHGVCQEQNSPPGYSCRCSDNYYGNRCEVLDPCAGSVCQNGGTCVRKTYGNHFVCECQPGFLGDRCEKENICLHANPCQNGGTCAINYKSDYQCSCGSRFTGTNCEIKNADIFQTMCQTENGSYPEGEFQWPSTFKGNTAFLACPYGVKEDYASKETELESNETVETEIEYAMEDFEQIRVSNLPPQEQANYTYSFGTPHTEATSQVMSRSKRSVLRADPEMTIPFVPRGTEMRHYRHSRSVDSSVITSHMSSESPSVTTLRSSENSSQRRISIDFGSHPSRASARVGVPGATRACVVDSFGNSVWLEPNLQYCQYPDASDIEIPTPAPEKVTPKIFVASVRNLAHLVDKALNDKQIAKRMMDAISNLLNVNRSVLSSSEEDTYNATDSIMETIDTYTAKVPLMPGQNIKLSAENLVVEAKVLNIKELPEQVAFHPFKANDGLNLEESVNGSSPTENSTVNRQKRAHRADQLDTIWIKVPKEALKNSVADHVRFQFASFKDDRIFRSRYQKSSLNMPVVSATISNSNICNLDTPVLYRIPVVDFNPDLVNPVCVYWDKTSKSWSSEGVTTRIIGQSEIQCESNHLTAFSIVLDPVAIPTDAWHSQILSIISSIGLTISTVALIATIATFALFRSLNRDRSGVIVMNLAIALLLLNISFLGATLVRTRSFACIPFATLLHYSVAASFAWMLIEAQNMYQLLVTVFPSAETHFMLKRLAFGWGLPLGLVAVALIWNKAVYVNDVSAYCVISPVAIPEVYYVTYLAPITLVLMLNLVVFFRVTSILCQRRPSYGSRNSKSSPEKPSHKSPPVSLAQFRGAVTIVALLGITWIAGVFAVGKLRIFLQYSFCVTTPLQGLIIFIVRVLQSAEARVAWRSFLLTGSRRRRHPTQISSVRTHSSQNSSSVHTQSTGVSPPNILTSALRKLSLGTLSSQNSFTGNNSKGRNSCSSNHSKNSSKCRKFAANNIANQSDEKKDSVIQRDAESTVVSANCKHNRNSLAYSSLLAKESDTNTIYESRLEDEPLKDLQQYLDAHPFFGKNRSATNLLDQEDANKCDDDTAYIISKSHVSLNKNENTNLLYQVYTLNERNISSTSNLSPQKKHSADLLNKNMRRSLGSLLSKSKDQSIDSQAESPPWNLIRLPPDGTCDPEECETQLKKSEEFDNDNKADHFDFGKDSHCDSRNLINACQPQPNNEFKDITKQGVSPYQKPTALHTIMYDINNSNEADNIDDIESKGLLIPMVNLPRAASYQNVAFGKIPLTSHMKKSLSINELHSLHPN